MNPLIDIKINKQGFLSEPKLIGISAMAGHGKTLIIRTLILDYIKSGINVILFSETNEEHTFENIKNIKPKKQFLGTLAVFNMSFADDIKNFNSIILQQLKFMTGNFIIIIDRPMFLYNDNSFIYTHIKNENTRFVIFEKHKLEKLLEYKISKTINRFYQQRNIAQSLRQLSQLFNTHVIVTSQQYNKSIEIDGSTEQSNSPLMYGSDIFFSIKRTNDKTFIITRVKDRCLNNTGIIKCNLNPKTLTLETIE